VDVALDIEGDFEADGVICVRGALSAAEVEAVQRLFDRALRTPSPLAKFHYPDDGSTYFTDFFHRALWAAYRDAFEVTSIPDLVGAVWGCEDVWFFFEQIFLKTGGATRRTPWHQDASYTPIAGRQQAVVWIPLTNVSQPDALEFVRGSHHGPVYAPSNFDPDDDTVPDEGHESLPRLPDIEAARSSYDIVSWAVEPGDVLAFHLATLHGGAATSPGAERRTVSLRYFGPDVVFDPQVQDQAFGRQGHGKTRPSIEGENPVAEMLGALAPGSRLSTGSWPKVRPRYVDLSAAPRRTPS
jgi:hypothetical protein